MSNCNKKHKSDTSSITTSNTKPTHNDEDEINNEVAIFVDDSNGNDPDIPCLENLEHENKDEKLNSISPENETETEKRNVNDVILERNVQDEIDLKNVESAQDNMEISDNMADACKTVCEICHKTFTLTNMRCHTLKTHKVQITEYKQIYGNFIIIKMVYHKCHLCGKFVVLDNDTLGGHIKSTHKMKEKDYKAKFMTLVVNKKLVKEDGDTVEQNPNMDVLKSCLKRKREKVDSSGEILKRSREKTPSLVRKEKRKRSGKVSKKSRKSKHTTKKINLEANIVREEMIEVVKDKPAEISNTRAVADDNKVNTGDVSKDLHENIPSEDTFNRDSIVADDTSNIQIVHVGKEITCSTEHVVKNVADNSENIVKDTKDVTEDFTDLSKYNAKDIYSEWISACELNGLNCNGGPTVKKGWRFCFEERTIEGCQVMVAKYMSPTGSIYVRGENGYQIPDLML